MDLFILDALLRRSEFVGPFISCVWTERFNEYGDFELIVESTPNNRARFIEGLLLGCSKSNYVGKIKTVEDKTDEEGRPTLVLTGNMLEEILEDRVAFAALDDMTTVPTWDITDPPADVIRTIFHDTCVTGILDLNDIIPMVTEGSFLPTSTIPEPVDTITVNLTPQTVGQAIKDIAQANSLGFRLVRQDDPPQLYFDVYAGSDRTSSQTTLGAVIFTP